MDFARGCERARKGVRKFRVPSGNARKLQRASGEKEKDGGKRRAVKIVSVLLSAAPK